jgi:hypothetical protein
MRALLLPGDPAREAAAVTAAAKSLATAGVTDDDQGELVRVEAERWAGGQPRDARLQRAVAAALRAGDDRFGAVLATRYFELHDSLQTKHHLSFRQASAFLSHARLAAHLAADEKLSAAQIAKLLAARDERADFHWQAVETVLVRLNLGRSLNEDDVESLFERDTLLEEQLFADAGVQEAAALVGEAGAELGFGDDLKGLLLRLVEPDLAMHGPYLKILFYQCVIAEFYDHALTALYEFSPRGQLADRLFNDWLGELEGGKNSFLDNAKAVDRLDLAWARSKKSGNLDRAAALVEVIQGLEEMGFAARQELAAWLRRWVLRIARLTRPLVQAVPESVTSKEVELVLASVGGTQTHTTGIIEQRLVDALAVVRHPADGGWRANGLGDSINASNVSRRKLGDCEFQHAEHRRVTAYEAHAGRLSEVYVGGHIETLRRVIPLRLEEWERIAELADWTIEIVFVAHDPETADHEVEVAGVPVSIRFMSFDDFFAPPPEADDLTTPIAEQVNAHLNQRRTPQRVRDAYLALLAG